MRVGWQRLVLGQKVRSHIASQKYACTHLQRTHSSQTLSARTFARTSHVQKCDFTHMCAATQHLMLTHIVTLGIQNGRPWFFSLFSLHIDKLTALASNLFDLDYKSVNFLFREHYQYDGWLQNHYISVYLPRSRMFGALVF